MTRPRPLHARTRDLAVAWPGALAQLAGALARCGVEAQVVLAEAWLPYLEVRKPGAVHSEKVYADRGRYLWSWGEYLGEETTATATAIAGLLDGGQVAGGRQVTGDLLTRAQAAHQPRPQPSQP